MCERKKITAPSSRKRGRPRHQNGGANKHNVSRSKTELRNNNNTDSGGVDTSNEIKSTPSNQNDKNAYGLDPSSHNNLSNICKTATNNNNNNNNNNVSKSPNINEENDTNHSASILALPPRPAYTPNTTTKSKYGLVLLPHQHNTPGKKIVLILRVI